MPDRSRKPTSDQDDANLVAKRIVDAATGDDEPTDEELRTEAAKILGRLGGLRGGPARAKKLTPKRRQQIARDAARARWGDRHSEAPEK